MTNRPAPASYFAHFFATELPPLLLTSSSPPLLVSSSHLEVLLLKPPCLPGRAAQHHYNWASQPFVLASHIRNFLLEQRENGSCDDSNVSERSCKTLKSAFFETPTALAHNVSMVVISLLQRNGFSIFVCDTRGIYARLALLHCEDGNGRRPSRAAPVPD